MSIHCPNCSALLEFDGEINEVLQEVTCPECDHSFYVGSNERSFTELDASQLLLRGMKTPQLSGASWEAPEPEEMDDAFDERYSIIKLLGRGGMGAVYLAKDTRLDRKVAIKILPPEMGEHAEALARFEREAKALAALEHPHIISVYDYGKTSEGHLYFVMEFIDGMDLHDLRKSGQLDLSGALGIVSQVCSALQYAHDKGIIHRDIKPANIMVSHKGVVKVADFGLAKALGTESRPNVDPTLTMSGSSMGTPDYMSPEQREGQKVDHRADIYALGVMLYDLLTGAPPRGAWSPPSDKVQIDIRLDEIIIRALQENPVARYQAAGELKKDVDSVQSTTGGSPIPAGTAVDPLPSSQRSSGIAKPRRAPSGGSSSATHQPVHDVPHLDAIVETTRSTNRTMLLLGTFAILTIGAIAIYVGAYKKDGDTYNTVNNTSYQEIQNNYFSQIIVNGTTTKEDLAMIQGIKPFGTLFIGMSKDALSLAEALDLAKRTGSTILDYTTDQPNKPAPLNQWITSAFSLQEKAWVSLHSQHQVIDGNAQLSSATAESKHHVLLAWQGPKELMMNAEQEEFKKNESSTEPNSLPPLGANLIKNPGCDMPPMGEQQIPHWTSLKGDWQQGSKLIQTNTHGSHDGENYFYAGKCDIGILLQEIELTPYQDKGIDFYFSFSAYVSAYAEQDDNTQIEIAFYDEDKLLFKLHTGKVSSKGIWLQQTRSGQIPKTATKVVINLISTRVSGGISNDGYFDSLSFKVEKEMPKQDNVISDEQVWNVSTIGFNATLTVKLTTTGQFTGELDWQNNDLANEIVSGSLNPPSFKMVRHLKGQFEGINQLWVGEYDSIKKMAQGKIQSETGLGNDDLWTISFPDSTFVQGIPPDALELNGYYYKAYPSRKNWDAAQKACESLGGQLAIADNPAIIHLLLKNLKTEDYWLNAEQKENKWVWANNTTLQEHFLDQKITHFESGQEYAITLNTWEVKFIPANKNNEYYYICQWKKSDVEIQSNNTTTSPVTPQIPEKAVKYRGNHYLVFHKLVHWYEANRLCESLGGHLAVVNDTNELNFLVKLSGDYPAWIGATNMTQDGSWQWVDGTPVSSEMLRNSNVDLPHLEHFLSLDKHFDDNVPYYARIPKFICEWEGDEKVPVDSTPETDISATTDPSQPVTAKQTLTNKAGVSIEVEILSTTETHVKVRLLKNSQEYDLKLDTLRQEDQDFIEAWKIVNPELDNSTSQNTPQPETSEIAQKIVAYASNRKRIKIGNGECWTLLDRTFSALKLERPGTRAWGQLIDWRTEPILPGDLIELETARFSTGHRVNDKHSAIISAVTEKQKLTVLHQNWGGDRTISEATLDLRALQTGNVYVYRVLPTQQQE